MVPYPRVRDRAEYTGHFRESEVMARLAKEYGYANVTIESFPGTQRSWYAALRHPRRCHLRDAQ
jgi:hypothetical protein